MGPTAESGKTEHSAPWLFETSEQKADLEATNLLRQYDEVERLIGGSGGSLLVTPEIVRSLQRLAIDGIYTCAGEYRRKPLSIKNSAHVPPEPGEVPSLVRDMCDYANQVDGRSPLHTAAYLLWRLNWIHPFMGGNGRTSRAVCYLALSIRLGGRLPGRCTIAEQIMADRRPYYDALDVADMAWRDDETVDVAAMESLLSRFLATQLAGILRAAKSNVQSN